MKLTLLSIFTLLLTSFASLAQGYKAMPTDSASWGLKYVTQSGTSYKKEVIKGDTLLAGNLYHKTYSNTGALLGFYRELNKKVYAKVLNHADTSEILLYDFNLNVGDTFYDKRKSSAQGTFFYKYQVTSITTSTATTDARKQYYFNCVGYQGPPNSYSNVGPACAFSWIEGIGSVEGLFNTRSPVEGLECFQAALVLGPTAYLVCFEHKNIQRMAQSCATLYLKELSDNLNFNIYPVPTTGLLTIDFNNTMDVLKVEIVSSLGQHVYQTNTVTQHPLTINLQDLPNGFYFLQLTLSNNLKKTVKIIKT